MHYFVQSLGEKLKSALTSSTEPILIQMDWTESVTHPDERSAPKSEVSIAPQTLKNNVHESPGFEGHSQCSKRAMVGLGKLILPLHHRQQEHQHNGSESCFMSLADVVKNSDCLQKFVSTFYKEVNV